MDNTWTITWAGSPYMLTARRVDRPLNRDTIELEGVECLKDALARLFADSARPEGADVTVACREGCPVLNTHQRTIHRATMLANGVLELDFAERAPAGLEAALAAAKTAPLVVMPARYDLADDAGNVVGRTGAADVVDNATKNEVLKNRWRETADAPAVRGETIPPAGEAAGLATLTWDGPGGTPLTLLATNLSGWWEGLRTYRLRADVLTGTPTAVADFCARFGDVTRVKPPLHHAGGGRFSDGYLATYHHAVLTQYGRAANSAALCRLHDVGLAALAVVPGQTTVPPPAADRIGAVIRRVSDVTKRMLQSDFEKPKSPALARSAYDHNVTLPVPAGCSYDHARLFAAEYQQEPLPRLEMTLACVHADLAKANDELAATLPGLTGPQAVARRAEVASEITRFCAAAERLATACRGKADQPPEPADVGVRRALQAAFGRPSIGRQPVTCDPGVQLRPELRSDSLDQ